METYNIKNDLKVFGVEVKTFPSGVGEVFDSLVKMFPSGDNRSYYGIATMKENGKMLYYATAEEKYVGEADKYKCERHVIEKGKYLAETLVDWQKNIHCIKDIFTHLIRDTRADKTKPAIEWYKNDKEMTCLVKTIEINE